MSGYCFIRSDLCSIPVAEQAELAAAVCGMLSADGYPPTDDGPLAPLARDVAFALVEAGFTLHQCDRYSPLWRFGMAYLMPILMESGNGCSYIAVCWTIHDVLLDWDRHAIHRHTCPLMNAVAGGILHAFGFLDRQLGTGGVCLVTSHRGQRMEARR